MFKSNPTPFDLTSFYRKQIEDLCSAGFHAGLHASNRRKVDAALRPLCIEAMERALALVGYCLRMDGILKWPHESMQPEYIELRRRYATERLELDGLFERIGWRGFVSTKEEAIELADMIVNPVKDS